MPPDFRKLFRVKHEREFMLPLAGLSLGLKQYSFELGTDFFTFEAYEDIFDGKVFVVLDLEKRENMIELSFHLEGWIEVACDRCGDSYHQSISGDQSLILKFGDHYEEESDEIFLIPADLHEFDIRQLLYEYSVLLLPLRKVHPEDTDGNSGCNQEVLNRLEQLKPQENIDPRWEALKNLNHLS